MDMQYPPLGKNIMKYRKKYKMSLDELSRRSGVSKSMLSQIEQEKTNPTVITVWKIARALNISMEELMETSSNSPPIEVCRKNDAPVFFSDDKSCMIRVNSPIHMADNLELYDMTFQPKGHLRSKAHFPDAEEFLTAISGTFRVTAGDHSCILYEGDTARYKADQEHSIENLSDKESRAYLVVLFPKGTGW
mgnify:CR=1 FL=1